mgnify:CR=1 FL=1
MYVQDLLREGAAVGTSSASAHVNLVSEISGLLVALEPELDVFNIGRCTRAIETLTELCQGNDSLGNAKQLCNGKVIGIAERLLLLRRHLHRDAPSRPHVLVLVITPCSSAECLTARHQLTPAVCSFSSINPKMSFAPL